MEQPSIRVCEWTVSLYKEKSRRWIYGTLTIYPTEIKFVSDDSKDAAKGLAIPFHDLVDVKKATTGLVFGAVYVVKKTNEKVWFSSLADREGVYGALRHFWKSQLFDQNSDRNVAPSNRTRQGQKLLGIVKDSEDTLSRAAVQLQNQGQQIDHALGTMSDLHSDLDIAENLVSDLDSWFGRWRMPQKYMMADPCIVNKSDIPEIFEFEILYTKFETGKANLRNVGILRLTKSTLTILTTKQKTVYHWIWGDVSQLRVVTPYEMVIVRYQLGKSDIKYGIVSAEMVAILKLLDKCARYKLKYDQPPEKMLCTRHITGDRAAGSRQGLLGPVSASTSSNNSAETSGPFHGQPRLQVQMDQSEQVVSEAEANEISRALGGLKTLALSVQVEESLQNEKLDSLTSTVENANQRLQVTDKKMKRMY